MTVDVINTIKYEIAQKLTLIGGRVGFDKSERMFNQGVEHGLQEALRIIKECEKRNKLKIECRDAKK